MRPGGDMPVAVPIPEFPGQAWVRVVLHIFEKLGYGVEPLTVAEGKTLANKAALRVRTDRTQGRHALVSPHVR